MTALALLLIAFAAFFWRTTSKLKRQNKQLANRVAQLEASAPDYASEVRRNITEQLNS